ncbi:MAG: hypothetical protein ABJG68_05125 [Crocinitomicaceae bacterium]
MNLKELFQNWGLEFLILGWFFFVLYPFGPAITFDSVSFIQAGENFWSGNGYVHSGSNGLEFAAHRFPIYPLILGLIGNTPWMLLVLQFLLFTVSLFAFRYLLKLLEAPRYFLTIFALSSLLVNYYCLWTEGLYGLLFILLFIQLKKEENFRPIVWVGVVVGFLCLTKMVGLVCGGALLMAYLFQKRYLRGFLIVVLSISVIIFWTLLGVSYLGETARVVEFHPIGFQDVKGVFQALGDVLLPLNSSSYLAIVLGVILFVFPLIYLIKHWKIKEQLSLLEWFLLIHFYGYIAFILLSKMFIDASIPIEIRTFFPLYLNLFVLAVLAIKAEGFTANLKHKLNYLLPKLILLFVGWNCFGLLDFRTVGVGYNSADWQSFEFTSAISRLDAEVVYTNDQAALNYFSDFRLNPKLLAEKQNLYTLQNNPLFQEEMDGILGEVASIAAARIVWIRNGITQNVYPTYEELKENDRLEIVYDDWLCLILKAK